MARTTTATARPTAPTASARPNDMPAAGHRDRDVTEGTPIATATPTGEMTPPTATPTGEVTPPTATPTGDVTPPTATRTIPACAALVSSGKSTSQSSTRGVHPASFAVDGTKDGAFAELLADRSGGGDQ